jgi:hypothetical protein
MNMVEGMNIQRIFNSFEEYCECAFKLQIKPWRRETAEHAWNAARDKFIPRSMETASKDGTKIQVYFEKVGWAYVFWDRRYGMWKENDFTAIDDKAIAWLPEPDKPEVTY